MPHDFDPKGYRREWLKGLREHVAMPALGKRIKARHEKKHASVEEEAIESPADEAAESPEMQAKEALEHKELHGSPVGEHFSASGAAPRGVKKNVFGLSEDDLLMLNRHLGK